MKAPLSKRGFFYYYQAMGFLKYSAFFIFGAIFGSFANVLIYRIPRKESIVYPGSHCPQCKTQLKWFDNIPLLSFIFLKGKCRYCGEKISIRYFIVELSSAFLFLLAAVFFESLPEALAAALFVYFLLVISFIDLEHMIIPDVLSLPFFIFSLLFLILSSSFLPSLLPLVGKKGIVSGLSGVLILLAFFLIIDFFSRAYFKKQGIGLGDIKLGLSLGLFLGYYSLLAPLLGYLLMAFFYPFLKNRVKDGYFPFGPFLSAGAVLTVFFGEELISWYLKTFL
jgi:leader peptidase (prepilin peptidase)/N-methyltransferase